jgi:hypothetical protein
MALSQKRFQKVQENFVCENCGFKVKGSGYTDHCPNCLYSKHVDINPGDRASNCGGLMKPIGVQVLEPGRYKIHYKCQKCGYKHKVKSDKDDNFDLILSLSAIPIID